MTLYLKNANENEDEDEDETGGVGKENTWKLFADHIVTYQKLFLQRVVP